MFRISEESYERVTEILEDIGYACDVEEEYEEWEDVARSSFASVLDELDTNQFDMTCAAISESIHDEYFEGNAKGIRTAFYGYLIERRDYLDFYEDYDKPELPDDADENEIFEYEERLEVYNRKKEYSGCVEKWISDIGSISFKEGE